MKKVKQKPTYYKSIVGYNVVQRKVVPLPLLCMRKPTSKRPRFPFFIFTSNPGFCNKSDYKPFMTLVCHRDVDAVPIDGPKYMMSESDFMDKMFIKTNNREPKYDYFYYTFNDTNRGIAYKGFDNFIKCLHVFNRMNLRGIVIVYFNGAQRYWSYPLRKSEFKLLNKSDLKIEWKQQDHNEVAETMSKCRFGLFPNKNDCSPRMIPECFIRNRPTLVNYDIMGGWKYCEQNKGFGTLFNPNDPMSIENGVNEVLALPRNQSTLWEQNYGFESSSRKLAELIKQNQTFESMSEISHIYFEEYTEALQIVGDSA